MQLPIEAVIQLLHEAPFGVLATHSARVVGHPFASLLPFVCTPGHAPMFLASELAEHTRNLDADPRASMLAFLADGDEPQAGARLTIIGEVRRFQPSPLLRARYLRYQPAAAEHLALGDFHFHLLEPQQLRMVAGFGRKGWIASSALDAALRLAEDDEARVLAEIASEHPRMDLLGIDCYGADVRSADVRRRVTWPEPCPDPARLADIVRNELARLATTLPTD